MHNPDHDAPPFNPVPPLIIGLAVIIALVEARFQLGEAGMLGAQSIGLRLEWFNDFAFLGPVFDWMVVNQRFPPEHLLRFVTYPFLHYDAVHAAIAAVLLLAMGKFVAERFAQWAVIVVIAVSAVAGALAWGLILDSERPLAGFYPAAYGLIGAYTFTLLLFYERTGESQLKAFQLIAILVVLQILFQFIGGGGFDWIADLAGFVAGFLVSFLVAPGGSYRLRNLVDQTRKRP